MELKNLKYFVEVAEQKSMNKAAMRLYISQPSLTRAIQNLEEDVGKKLLIRTNRGVTLTEDGENVYHYAKAIRGQVESIEKIKQQEQRVLHSKVGISVARIILSDDLMLRYKQKIKAQHLIINMSETTVESLLDEVATLKSDIGLLVVNTLQLPVLKKVAEIRELEINEIGSSPLYVHMDKENQLMQQEEVAGNRLINHTHIHLPLELFSNLNYALEADGVGLTDIKRTITMNNYHSIICMLKHSDSFIFGNKWQIKELEKGGILSRKFTNFEHEMRLIWVKRKRDKLSENAKKFLELFIENYS